MPLTPLVSLDQLVLHDGDRVHLPTALVASWGGRTWLDPLRGWYAHDPRDSVRLPEVDSAVWVDGVDLDRLAEPRERDGVRSGRGALTGRWRAGRLVVEEQGEPEPAPPVRLSSDRLVPPVPAPADGWQPVQAPTPSQVARLLPTPDELGDWARTQPDGLLLVDCWLRPAAP